MRNHQKIQRRALHACSVIAIAIGLTGCANKPAPLYDWQGYQDNVNDYLRGDHSSLDSQTKSMETDLQKIRAANGVVPPGYHAHLGLLYVKQGNLDEFTNRLDAEKAQYPESQTFVDFLLRKFKRKE